MVSSNGYHKHVYKQWMSLVATCAHTLLQFISLFSHHMGPYHPITTHIHARRDLYFEGSLFVTAVFIITKGFLFWSFNSEQPFFLHASLWKFITTNVFYSNSKGLWSWSFLFQRIIILKFLFRKSLFWEVIIPKGCYSKRSIFLNLEY